jgi:hypothetical protein
MLCDQIGRKLGDFYFGQYATIHLKWISLFFKTFWQSATFQFQTFGQIATFRFRTFDFRHFDLRHFDFRHFYFRHFDLRHLGKLRHFDFRHFDFRHFDLRHLVKSWHFNFRHFDSSGRQPAGLRQLRQRLFRRVQGLPIRLRLSAAPGQRDQRCKKIWHYFQGTSKYVCMYVHM